jgi:5,10-methylenetetrahydromethanopterin reductase
MDFRVFVEPQFGWSYDDQLAVAQEAERLGFNAFFRSDHYLTMSQADPLPGPTDSWITLAGIARETSTIRLGTCVTNVETRHASVTASAAATLDELAPGRVILGVGTGDSSVKTLGQRPTRLDRMREQLGILRALLAGDEVAFDGRAMRLEAPPENRVPVYLAANAPKALALAGELCDGAIFLSGFEPELVASTRERLAAGAARADRSLDAFDVCVGTICHVTDDPGEAARVVRPYVVAMAQTGGRDALRGIGIEIDPPEVVAGIYPDMSHARDWDAASEAAREWVDDETALRFADAYCLVGSAAECVRRLRAAAETGATSFYVRHVSSYTLPEDVLDAYGRDVIPRFRPT